MIAGVAAASRTSRDGLGLFVVIGFMYMAQTFPSAFANSLLPTIFRKEGLDLKQFWVFSLPLIPYWLRFLWAPVVDSYWWPRLGRRRSWFIPCTILAAALYASLAFLEPTEAALAILVAILFVKSIVTATQEIAIDAYVVDSVRADRRSISAGVIVVFEAMGQMLALIGLGAVIERFGWPVGAAAAAALMVIFLTPAFIRREEPVADNISRALVANRGTLPGLYQPLLRFVRRPDTGLIAPMLLLSGLFTGGLFPLLGPFLIDMGFSVAGVGAVTGITLASATLLAATAAVALIQKLGAKRTFTALLFLVPIGFAPAIYVATARPELGQVAAIAVLLPATLGVALFYVAWNTMRLAFASVLQAGTDYSTASAITRIGQTLSAAAGGPIAAWLGWTGFFTALALLGVAATAAATLRHDRLMRMIDERNRQEVGNNA